MKAILEFDLNDPDDRLEHMRAIKSFDMAIALYEIQLNSYKELERLIEHQNLSAIDTLDKVFERINEVLDKHGIKIDDLIN
jgi:hypothetical protein